MKSNKFLLACILLLAIFTIGAACASENVTQDDAVAAESDDISLENDSSDVLGGESYYDDDFYITVEENYSQDIDDWDSNELVYISSYSQKNGTVKVSVDDVEKQSYNITDGYFSVEDDGYGGTYNRYYQYVYPKDLGIENCGTYNVKIRFNDNLLIDTSVTMSESADFDIWLQNPYYCEQEYWEVPSFIIIDSNHFNNGTLEIFVNGTRKISYAVNNGLFEEISNCSNRSRYVAPSDLFEGYGAYNVQINFTENGVTETLKDEEVLIGEFPPTTNPSLDVYLDLYVVNLPADNVAHIYLPREANGTLTVTYNDVKNKVISYSKGYAELYIEAWNLNHLGENTLTFTYTGDDFGTLTAVVSCFVQPTITIPDYVNLGDEFTISMMTHEWVKGKFNVYDYTGNEKGNLLASGDISNRRASVNLLADTQGLNKFYLEFAYPGGENCQLIREVYVVSNSGNITAEVPGEIERGKNLTVKVNAPDIDWTFVQIKVDNRDTEFALIENGEAVKNISDLTTGYHAVMVLYDNRVFDENGDLVGDVYLETFTVNVGVNTSLTASDVVCDYNSTENLTVTLKDVNGNVLRGKDIVIAIDGVNYTRTTDDNGHATLEITQIPGNYTAEIAFAGSEGYLSSMASCNVSVDKLSTSLFIYNPHLICNDGRNICVGLVDAKGRYLFNKNITIVLNGTAHVLNTENQGWVMLVYDLLPGNYTAEFSFAGDEIYLNSSGSQDIELHKMPIFLEINGPVNTAYGENDFTNISFFNPNSHAPFANEKIIMDLNGTEYNCTTDENGYLKVHDIIPVGNYVGSFTIVDERYGVGNYSVEINISKAEPYLRLSGISFGYDFRMNLTFILHDRNWDPIVNKNITFTVDNISYGSDYTDESGLATVNVPFKVGKFVVITAFEGDDNYLPVKDESTFNFDKIQTNLTASDVVTTYGCPANLTVTLKDMLGTPLKSKEIIIELDGKNITGFTNENGQVILPIDLAGGWYLANIYFLNDEFYNDTVVSAYITVYQASSSVEVNVSSVVYPDNVTVNVRVVNATVVTYFVETSDGRAVIENTTLSSDSFDLQLAGGSYVIYVANAGNDNFSASVGFKEFVVGKASSSVEVNASSAVYPGKVTVNVGVVNATVVTYVVKTSDGKVVIENTPLSSGSFDLQLAGGSYVIYVSNAGNENISASSASAEFNVIKLNTKLTAPQVNTVYNNAKNLVITLKDENGNVLSGKTVTVALNGNTYNRITDKNGQAVISVNLPAKQYTANINFAGDANYTKSGVSTKVVVSKAKPKLTAKSKTFKVKAKTKKVTATLKDNKGRAMKNVKLTLKIKSKKYTAKTNKKGIATFKVKLTKKGKYSAKITFKANSNYKAASKTVKIKIK